jgi:muconolactone delta-isomerase
MQFIVTGRAIDGLPMPPAQALAAYKATFELLAADKVPHVKAAWPHADERATTLLVEVDTAEQLGETLAGLPGFMLSTWEAHAVSTPAHVAESLARMEAALNG